MGSVDLGPIMLHQSVQVLAGHDLGESVYEVNQILCQKAPLAATQCKRGFLLQLRYSYPF